MDLNWSATVTRDHDFSDTN